MSEVKDHVGNMHDAVGTTVVNTEVDASRIVLTKGEIEQPFSGAFKVTPKIFQSLPCTVYTSRV